MTDDRQKKDSGPQRGNVRYLWVLVGGYLAWLGVQQLMDVYHGVTSVPAVSLGAGVLFIAVGGFVLWREWQAYQYALAHRDDPETWGGEPEKVVRLYDLRELRDAGKELTQEEQAELEELERWEADGNGTLDDEGASKETEDEPAAGGGETDIAVFPETGEISPDEPPKGAAP